jgi:glycosyltransferase involved in cell wall biosynthesis
MAKFPNRLFPNPSNAAPGDSGTKLKILWIYPELPYPLTSGLLRGFHLLRGLGERHAVTFLCLTQQGAVPAETLGVLSACAAEVMVFGTHDTPRRRWAEIVRQIPVIGWRLCGVRELRWALKQMKLAVRKLLQEQNFSVVLFSGRETIPVLDRIKLPIVAECCDTNCTRVLQQVHCVSLSQRPRIFYRYLREWRQEKKLVNMTPYRCFISERDRTNLMGPGDQSEIVPQGVDYEYWARSAPPSENNCIVFSGVMNYPPNADAVMFLMERVLPLVRKSIPALEVLIVGRDPSEELRKAASAHRDVTIVGAVPDLRPYLERADVFVAALRFASGVQNKVLEAMSMEIPVVTTPVVTAGLRIEEIEPPLLTGDNARKIADGIIDILTHPEERARLSKAGRQFVKAHYSWSTSADKLANLCLAAAQSGAATAERDRNSNQSLSAVLDRNL